jgi:hypothetical protein
LIKVKIKLNLDALEKDISEFESRVVRVGVLDDFEQARKPDLRKFGEKKPRTKALREATGKRALRIRKKSNLKMKSLAKILDAEYGVFSKASLKYSQMDLIRVIDELSDTFGNQVNPTQQRRIENACIALVRNPIMRREFKSNSANWEKTKGFDWTMVSTGSFLQSIEAEMNV